MLKQFKDRNMQIAEHINTRR